MEYGDLMHETLLVAHKGFSKLRCKDAFLSYLIGIAIRVLANSNRKKKPEKLSDTSDYVDGNMKTDLRVEIDQLHTALSKLPEGQRESIICFEIVGFSIKEIASLHEVGESAVKQRLRRGRIALAEIMNETSAPVKADK